MGDCHLPPYSPSPPKCLPGDEKYCKFSYASWCPTCEKNSPRRRSKSETMNNGELPACRRKCKEMKTLSPRKHHGRSSQEYENMDLEYDTKECLWLYEPPKDNNGYYNHRVRSNLMELPTSYISNNYQTSKQMPPLPPPQLPTTGNSNDPSVETRNHGKTHPVDGSGHHSNSPINNKSTSSRLAEDLTLSNNTSPHHNNNNNKLYHHHYHHRPGAPAGGRKLPVVSSNHVAGNAVAASAIAAAGAESGGVCTQFKSENRGAATLPSLSDIVYDTSTFFDKLRSDDNSAVINNTTNNTTTNHNNTSFSSSSSIPGNFQDRFTKELESMRERLATWRKSNSQKPDTDRGEGQTLLDFPSLNELLRNGSTNNNNGCAAPKSFDFTKFRDRYFREDPGTAHSVTNKAHIHSKLGKPTSPASSALSPEEVPGPPAHPYSVESTSDSVDCGKIERSPKKQSSISQQILKQLEDDLMKVENCKKLERIEKLQKEVERQPKTNNFNNNNNSRAESGRSITKRVVLRTRPKSTNLKVKKPTRIVVKPANKSFNETSDEESSDDVTTSDVEDLSAECDSAATSEESTSNTTTTSSDSRTKSPETDDSASLLLQGGSGDNDTAAVWPVIRESLFPNIPPYIRFVPHDADQPAVKKAPLSGGRYLFKWKLSTITPLVVRKTLTNSGFVLVRSEFTRESNQWLGTWGKHMKSPMFKTLKDTQKCNHFPGTFQLGRKDRLWRNFQRMINRYGYREFGFIPQTFILPQELKLLKQNWEYKNGDGGETWIIKPPASARGVGIKVINKWSHLPKKQSLVVQKYISNPYLINGSKFDLRLYVLVTSFNPLRIYLYPEGLARFASAKYSDDVKDLKDIYMHLTNYSINKLSSQYSANEDANACQGHKWTLTKLLEYLSDQGVDTDTLWKNLQQLCIKTIISGDSPINSLCEENMPTTYNCYELFGIDVLLDDQLKPWLLEVNISPSLHSASPLDAHVKGPMVHTLFDLAQFHFPPRLAQLAAGGKLPPNAPQCYDARLYSTSLTKKEREKHILFEQYERRSDYLDDILVNLTGDDVRKLCQAEDEFVVKERFQRIFPTAETFRYLNFMRPGYYNRLCDAWETKFEKNRADGVKLLRSLCHEKVHLKVPSQNSLHKNSQNTIPSALITSNHQMSPSKNGHSRPLDEVMQDINIENVPSRN